MSFAIAAFDSALPEVSELIEIIRSSWIIDKTSCYWPGNYAKFIKSDAKDSTFKVTNMRILKSNIGNVTNFATSLFFIIQTYYINYFLANHGDAIKERERRLIGDTDSQEEFNKSKRQKRKHQPLASTSTNFNELFKDLHNPLGGNIQQLILEPTPSPTIIRRFSDISDDGESYQQIVNDAISESRVQEFAYAEPIVQRPVETSDLTLVLAQLLEHYTEPLKIAINSFKTAVAVELAKLTCRLVSVEDTLNSLIKESGKDHHQTVDTAPFEQCETFNQLLELNEKLKTDAELWNNSVRINKIY